MTRQFRAFDYSTLARVFACGGAFDNTHKNKYACVEVDGRRCKDEDVKVLFPCRRMKFPTRAIRSAASASKLDLQY